jgi:hypothetical protein
MEPSLSRTPYSSPEDLWMKQLLSDKNSTSSQALVPTGFLMSSIPRVTGVKGLGWAPKNPALPWKSHTDEKWFPAYPGNDSRVGEFTGDGLKAVWLECTIKSPGLHMLSNSRQRSTSDSPCRELIAKIVAERLGSFLWGALIRPVKQHGDHNHKDDFEKLLYEPFPYEGYGTESVLLAVIGSEDVDVDGLAWKWIDVLEWPSSLPLPTFKPGIILLV